MLDGSDPDLSGFTGADWIELPVIKDPRGDLTFVEGSNHVPFDIARVYYLYNVPMGSARGGHAHHNLLQVIFALSGSFVIRLDNGRVSQNVFLNNPQRGLLIGNLVWREMDQFSQGAVCMVIASMPYDESDYIREFSAFTRQATTG